jgi:hypothetical protein
MKSSNSLVPITLEYQRGLLVAPYISSMSHNNGGVTNLRGILVLEFEESPLDDDEGAVGGLNRTLHLMKPLITMSLSLESCVTSMMNLKTLTWASPLKFNHKKVIHLQWFKLNLKGY